MATLMSRFPLGDMAALYLTDEEKHVGFLLVPVEAEPEIVKKDCAVDSLVQVHVRGDLVPPRLRQRPHNVRFRLHQADAFSFPGAGRRPDCDHPFRRRGTCGTPHGHLA